MGRFTALAPLALALATAAPAHAGTDAAGYSFDSHLLRGVASGQSLTRFNRPNAAVPGTYGVDVILNGESLGRRDLRFEEDADHRLQACFSPEDLAAFGVLPELLEPLPAAANPSCRHLAESLDGASERLDFPRLRLELSIPQASLHSLPRGHIPVEEWDDGGSLGFIGYNASHFRVTARDGHSHSSYLGLNAGLNLAGWRLRHQASLNTGNDMPSVWKSLRTYAQRSLPGLQSEVTVGETFTSGQLLSSMGYRGIQLASDERMLPDSLRGYAPTVHGIANSNARVVIRQDGNELYQTTVAPGPFAINDLFPTGYGGDLEVEVTEADGRTSTFKVPYSPMPNALRPGLWRYSLAAGQVRHGGMDMPQASFVEGSFEYGLSNALTARLASRAASGYLGTLVGGVYTNSLGAFGLSTTVSRAEVPDGQKRGWMSQATYSRTFQGSGTNLSIGSARYSTEGYRELIDALGERESGVQGDWSSGSYQQRSRLDVQVNQRLAGTDSLYLAASTQSYRNRKGNDRQLQFGYSGTFANGIGYNLAISRRFDSLDQRANTLHMLSISIPLGSAGGNSTLTASTNHSGRRGYYHQANLSGTAGEARDLTYGLNVSHAEIDHSTVLGGTLQKRFPNVALSGSLSRGTDFWQVSANAMGSLAIHSGGITAGPYLGDTFALIEAKGAEGALVMNGQGARIDRFGYALLPTLAPYRYNVVGLNSEGMAANVELQETQKRVVPTAGAALRLTFDTLAGYALLLRAPRDGDEALPMGAEVYDAQGRNVGMVGQASQLYARVEQERGQLTVRWGEAPDEQCVTGYAIAEADRLKPMIHLESACRPAQHP
ncbi:fimbria/pilus outer membrane usher protein [Pseudomonas sp. Q1-7]|uniref:fimbria/pilus outer membrane usher protein n=1 Tax=Pseudomonas sp. Q1-7 TaxID=3020843 RepID=UPI0023006EF4|nr:fimbria/pilus outer membrane usher protein [Pseudomonas sp. Q1-7]